MKKILVFLGVIGMTLMMSSCFGPGFWDDGPMGPPPPGGRPGYHAPAPPPPARGGFGGYGGW